MEQLVLLVIPALLVLQDLQDYRVIRDLQEVPDYKVLRVFLDLLVR